MAALQTAMSIEEAIHERHSVRTYADSKLDRSTIEQLLEAAIQAPTALHEEPWRFVIIQDRALLKQISDRAKTLFTREMAMARSRQVSELLDTFSAPEFNVFYNAGTLIAICADSAERFADADCWLAAENLMLSACSLGLGSCVIGSAASAMNLPELKATLRIPPGVTVVAPIIVGYPANGTHASPRKQPHVLAWM